MRTLWKLGSLLPGRIAKNIDTRGEVFFQSGWLVVSNLDKLAGLLRRRDLSSVGNLYAASFSGTSFSLVNPVFVKTQTAFASGPFARRRRSPGHKRQFTNGNRTSSLSFKLNICHSISIILMSCPKMAGSRRWSGWN